MRNPTIALLALVLVGCKTMPKQAVAPPALLILISVDGLRPDYLQRGVTPHINALAASGARARLMRPSFPSLTFPNHYTLVTGMRPDDNGIVNNSMEDPAFPQNKFALSNRAAVEDRRWWDQAEPAWVTAENAGVRTATMFWPGSEAPIHGVRPTQWIPFDGKLPNHDRIKQILTWIDQPKRRSSDGSPTRPGFMTLYFDTVDHKGHEFGPDAPETTAAMAEVDARIGDLVAGLKVREVAANILLVSDHGMANVSPDRVIRLDLALPPGSFRTISAGAVAGLEPLPGQEAVLAAALLKPRPHIECWRKGKIPRRLRYGRNPRVPSFVCAAESGWMILTAPPRPGPNLGGMHGYDPAAPDMAAIFIAAGPAIRPGTLVAPFDNVDVYPLLMRLIGVRALHSDGSQRLAGTVLR